MKRVTQRERTYCRAERMMNDEHHFWCIYMGKQKQTSLLETTFYLCWATTE
jgi:hypothetical protein